MSAPKKVKKIRKYLRLLEKRFGRPFNPVRKPVLDQVAFYQFFIHVGNAKAKKTLKDFREEYVDWNEVRVSSLGQISETVSAYGMTPEVAVTIKGFLNHVYNEHNSLSIEFLRDESNDNIRKFFSNADMLLHGTVAFLLMVNKESSVVPPEKPLKRVAERIGLAGRGWTRSKVAKTFRVIVPEKEALKFFQLALEHSRSYCTVENPRCANCPMESDCDFRARVKDREKKKKANKSVAAKPAVKAKPAARTKPVARAKPAVRAKHAPQKKKKRKRKLMRRSRSSKKKAPKK